MIKNSLIFGLTTLIKGALSFALIATYTRLLSADSFGDYAIIIALINVADVFGFMWLRQVLMRHITDEEDKADQAYFANALLISAIIAGAALILSLILVTIGVLSSEGQEILYELLGLIVFTESVSNLVILMARLRFKLGLFFLISIAKPLIALTAGTLFILNGFDVAGAVWGILISCALASLLGVLKLSDFHTLKQAQISRQGLRAVFAFGLPLIAALSIQSLIKATDRILLEGIIGGDITGLYAAAQDIPYKLLTILITAIHLAAYPLAVKALDYGSQEQCRAQLSINAALLWAVALPAAAAIAILSPSLAHVFLGEAFRPFAIQYFGIFAAISLINCAAQYYFVLSFNLSKKTKLLIPAFLIALAINAALGIALIPSLGAQGAMIGSAAAYSALLLSVAFLGWRIFPLPIPIAAIVKITLAAAAMSAALLTIDLGVGILPLAGDIVIGGTVYAAAIWLLNPMNVKRYITQNMMEKIRT